ncbi:MAG: 16S rRNA (uracil(1498)-N(3))-methyltransferase [Clostridiales bacterium]|nr:16S rRNA (uracil(1498)-N(3))-methyltransferase [Clostridiales bacterium]
MPKFFTEKNLINENTLEIKGEEALHISEVLRIKSGEEITVGDGDENDYVCKTVSVKKSEILCDIIEKKKNENEPNVKITLFQALPKGDKMELVIQKCIEIGVVEIIPIDTRNSMVKLKGKEEKKIARWNKIALSAAKQCGRGIIPEVKPLMSFKDAADMAVEKFDGALMPYECERVNSIKTFAKGFKGKSLAIFIGSEGGFDQSEVNYALSKGISTVTMGKRILRTETAGLAASVIILYEAGDLS